MRRAAIVRPKAFLSLLLMLVLQHSSAAAEIWDTPVDFAQPSQAFRDVTKRMQEIRAMGGGFVQLKTVEALTRPLRSEGTFLYSDDVGLCWKTEKPFPSELVVSQGGIIQRGIDGEQEKLFTENTAVVEGFSRIFLGTLSGHAEQLSRSFEVFFSGSSDTWQLGFKPKVAGAKRMLQHILLEGKAYVHTLEVRDAAGDDLLITFQNIKTSREALPDTQRGCFDTTSR